MRRLNQKKARVFPECEKANECRYKKGSQNTDQLENMEEKGFARVSLLTISVIKPL